MDDQRVGAAFRAIRHRKRWRQQDLAARASVSRWIVMRIERGRLSGIPLTRLRRVAEVMDARIVISVRWQGGDLDRLLNARHSKMHEVMARTLAELPGWSAEPEVSFSIWGERGVIDILAWHAASRTLLVIELKTELVDVNELMSTLDRKRRLAATVARDRGLNPNAIGIWVVLADSRTNRRAVASHVGALRAKLPTNGRGVARWLKQPQGSVAALSFLPQVHHAHLGLNAAPIRRVVLPRARPQNAAPRSP